MVSVVGNDAGTVLHTDNELGTTTNRVILPESVKPSTSPPVADTVTDDNCAGTSGTNEPQNDGDGHEQQPQCSCQKKTEQERKSMCGDTATAQDGCGGVNHDRTESDHSRKGTTAETACQDNHHRSCTTAQATCSASSSVHPSVSMPADSVQTCGSLRRPNVSYALAARSNLTRRAASAEESPSSSTPSSSESAKPPQAAPSVSARQKLAKQMTVDETSLPIYVGAPDEDYLQPAANTSSPARPCSAIKERQAELRPASVDILRRPNGIATPSEERPRSVDVVVTSTIAAKPLRIPVPKGFVAQDVKSVKRKLSKSKSLAQPISVNQSDESDYTVPVTTANHRTTGGPSALPRPQPISVNLPDEVDELRPVRELLPERLPGAPTVVRVEKHPYAGTVPSRARQLVRSLAMCGDDDTRLRPPPPPMMNTYASVASVGVPPRFHRNSSSLSRESSYTDYTSDLTEMELRAFIAATLHKNARDRAMILELEQLFTDFVGDLSEQSMKLPPVSSYNRMLIHRVAVLFGLDHNVDNSGKCVVVSKTSKTKAPDFPFASLIQSNIYTDSRRYGPNYNMSYPEIGIMDAMQRRAQSFETGYIYPSADPDLISSPHPWTVANQRSFEKQPHYSYQMGAMDHSTMMRKAGSFSGVPAIYRSGSGTFENFDRSQMKPGQSHSLASSSHLSPREPIDETVERFNNASLSDRASQLSYRSSGSNPTPHPPIYQPYPPVVPYPVSEEMMYPTYQQQVYMQPTTMLTPTSVEMYQSQPAIVMPMQQNPAPVQQPVPLMQCQPPDQLAQVPQTSLEPSAQMVSAQPEYIQYPAQQYPAQVITCTPQQFQAVPHTPTYQAQYQHVVYPQQVVQQPLMQPQQYQPTFVQAPVQQQYQPSVVQTPVQQGYVPQQPMVHVQSPVYQQPPQIRQQYPATAPMAQQQYVEVNRNEQQQPNPYQPIVYGQWVPPSTEHYQETGAESETLGNAAETEQSEAQVACTAAPVPMQTRIGKTSLTPLSVLVNPEPMYHYSQTSPVMSSMQQQQMLQIQCHTRPLLYRPTQQYTAQQPSVDGGYCSMTQDSLRESDIGTADAQ